MKTAMEHTTAIPANNPALQRMALMIGCAFATTLWAQLLLVVAGG
ncbi:hypothetical protein T8K17_22350 [Thalassobaculum sp. OXR-137]|nr:hypothetical protein [Thalassobaculum sp. OXR-137]WPZ33968.1 hypothetical protein T8K17_22350 [Thalassobaculum sp. OXR-137]